MDPGTEHRLTTLEESLKTLDLQTKRNASHIESESGTVARAHGFIHQEIGKIKLILEGNGKPEAGLVHRFLVIEERQKDAESTKRLYLSPFLSALFGGLVAHFLPKVFGIIN